jgi:hypothetical protein
MDKYQQIGHNDDWVFYDLRDNLMKNRQNVRFTVIFAISRRAATNNSTASSGVDENMCRVAVQKKLRCTLR